MSSPALDSRSLSRFLGDWMQSAGVPGMAIAVVDAEEVIHASGLGSRDYQRNLPATPDTLFGIASCTKSFTALAIMQLQEAGELAVTDPINDHLPYDVWTAHSDVTIHDLLTHSSSFPGDGMAYLLIDRQLGLGGEVVALGDKSDLIEYVDGLTTERMTDADDGFFYLNSGYFLLGEIVAYRSGQPYDEYVESEILDPLDMDRTTYHESDVQDDDNALTPYLLEDSTPREQAFPFDPLIYAAGGLLSSPNELGAYLRMYLNGGMADDGRTVISEESIEAMHRGYLEWDYGMSSSANRYGYGWTVKEAFEKTVVSHIGDILVSSAYLAILPDEKLGVAIAANTSPPYIMQSVGEGVLAIMFDLDPYEAVPFFSVRRKLDRLVGRYVSYRGVLSGTVEREGVTLRFRTDKPPMMDLMLLPASTDHDDFDLFVMSEEGERKPVEVAFDDGEPELRFARWRLRRIA